MLISDHPERAAAVLERSDPTDAVELLSSSEPGCAAVVLRSMSPGSAKRVLETGSPQPLVGVLAEMEIDDVARLVRSLSDDRRAEILRLVPTGQAEAAAVLLQFPARTAGALMDLDVAALPQDLTAREALVRIRSDPESARYNLYVIDREHHLVGALNLRELLLAKPRQGLAAIMVRNPMHLPASADESMILGHPGWKEVHSLPVVDEQGRYLGAIRYRVLTGLQEKLLRQVAEDSSTAASLGDLFATGAAGVLEALTGSGQRPTGGN
jgi:magnesium transporter